VVRAFIERVKDKAVGHEVLKSLTPAQQVVKVVHDELCELLGGSGHRLAPAAHPPTIIMLIGLQGSGKTTTAAKLARLYGKQGQHPILAAADTYRPAAQDQLRTLGAQLNVPVVGEITQKPLQICRAARDQAAERGLTPLILDTAGRLHIDEVLLAELKSIRTEVAPHHVLLVVDAMTGQDAVTVADRFNQAVGIDAVVLTKLDGDSRGGAALAIRAATGVPVRFVAVGEATDKLEAFRAEGLAQRVLGQGDVVGLMQEFEAVVDVEEAEKDAERMLRGKFSFDDFLTQLRTLQKMGSLTDLLAKIPGVSDMMPEGAKLDPSELKRIEAMITSMTPAERQRPELISASRQNRIARGSGTKVQDVGGLLQRFKAMREMMASLGGAGGLLGKLPGVGRMFGAGGGAAAPEGFDPSQLAGLGGMAPNRRAARAQKALAKREQRKAQKKHKRRGKRR